jgi:hypothetical protein
MRKLATLATLLVGLVAVSAEAHAAKTVSITQCDDPGASFFNITKAGSYQLENDIEAIGLFCIHINGIDRVKLRLNGYSISNATVDQGYPYGEHRGEARF